MSLAPSSRASALSVRPVRAIVLLVLAHLLPGIAHSQQGPPETIRGRVVGDSARAVAGASVMVTRGPDRLTMPATTDANGDYRVTFPVGTGDYLVYVSAMGYKPVRRRVQRQGEEHEFVVGFVLAPDVTTLAAVKVTAEKPERARNGASPMEPEPGSSEKWQDGVNGQISPAIDGDLAAVAGTMSNVTVTPAGPSILGAGAESNLNTLNGMSLAGGSVPRAAITDTRVTGATFDVTRGGFSGAQTDVVLRPGDRFFQHRQGFVTLDPPALQYASPVARTLGTTMGGLRASVGAGGEAIRDALTYHVALEVSHAQATPANLLNADADALALSGVAPDSVARLLAVAWPLGLAFSAGPTHQRQRDGVTWLSRLDDTRDTLSTRALTSYAGYTRDGALGTNALAAPSASGERRERTLGAQLTLGAYVGEGRRTLTETRLGANAVHAAVTPYTALPGVNVLVRSSLPGSDATDVSGIVLGGGSSLASDETRWTTEGSNETTWNAGGRRHRFRTLLWARADGLRQQGNANTLGGYGYNSIADLAAGRPSSFSRTLSQPERSGTVWNAATALAHLYAPSRWFSLIYGARVEADGFASSPATNPLLEQSLGVRTGASPLRLHVSPRIGFTYTFDHGRYNGSGMSVNMVGRFFGSPRGTLRGGIGEFRDLLRPGLLADASAATGLPGATYFLSCVGAAVPPADFTGFANGSVDIPSQCADGGGALAERAPAVTLIDPSYDVPRRWRASLDWSTSTHAVLFKLAALASYDLNQPGWIDANFSGVKRLTLAGEGGRPVYVSAAGIDAASGRVSPAEARRSDLFGRVNQRVSDLRGYGGQLTATLSSNVFRLRTRGQLFGSLAYTLQGTRRQYRGFDGAAFGDPRVIEWADGENAARHVAVLTSGFSTPNIGTVTLFARLQSGLPFTPIVQGDVNGDGRGGDRAFIPDPAVEADAALAAGMRTLLATGSSSAVSCLNSYLGGVADRNGCRGPWTQSLNVQWSPRTPARWDNRVRPTLYFQNVLAGVDQALHGGSPRGWGSPALPDPVLLVPRGFDAAASRFRYDVNPRFAETRGARTLLRDPFRVVIDFALNLSTNYDVQQLRRATEPVRSADGWHRKPADSISAVYLRRTSSIYKLALSLSDSLFITRTQAEALQRADSAYSVGVRALYAPLGEFLANGQGNAGKAELDSVQTTQKAYWKLFWLQVETAEAIVTPVQLELLPILKSMIATPLENRDERMQYGFGFAVAPAGAKPNPPPSEGGGQRIEVRKP